MTHIIHLCKGTGPVASSQPQFPVLGAPRGPRLRSWGLAGLSVLLSACQSGPAGHREVPAPLVEVEAAAVAASPQSLKLSGSLEPERSHTLSFAVPGTVEQILVREGETVKAGQVLARLSARTYQDAVGLDRARLKQAEDAYGRMKPMYESGSLPEIKMVEVETGREQARLAMSISQKNLGDTILRAPEDGSIAFKHLDAGANTAPGVPVLTLVQTDTILAEVAIPEARVGMLKPGTIAVVKVAATRGSYEATLRELAVVANPMTRTYTARFAIANGSGELRAGMVAEVRVPLAAAKSAIFVPAPAIRVDETGSPYVYIVNADERLVQRKVSLGEDYGDGNTILKGIESGERVVSSRTPMLADGVAVRVRTRQGDQ